MGDPSALILPAPIPIPAFWDTYLTILLVVALILSKLSAVSMSTQDENCLCGVLTPAITGVGKLISKVDIAS
jgi:hypothetical protein